MTIKIFYKILAIPLTLFSCSEKNPDMLSREEINLAKTEVKTTVEKMLAYAEEANIDSTLTFYLNNPEFVYVSNGRSLSYSEMSKEIKNYFNQITGQRYNIIHEKISFPAKSLVFYTGHFLSQANLKNSDSILLRPFIQFYTFKKIENKWKVIYAAESVMPEIAGAVNQK
jgi:hypothetical protein